MEFIECLTCHSLYNINVKKCDFCKTELNQEISKPKEDRIDKNISLVCYGEVGSGKVR
jgi:hypothetical protein